MGKSKEGGRKGNLEVPVIQRGSFLLFLEFGCVLFLQSQKLKGVSLRQTDTE